MVRSKGIRIPKSGKFLLVKSGMPGFRIRNTGQGFWNPSSTDKDSGIHGVESRIQYCLGPLTWGEQLLNMILIFCHPSAIPFGYSDSRSRKDLAVVKSVSVRLCFFFQTEGNLPEPSRKTPRRKPLNKVVSKKQTPCFSVLME